MNGAVEGAVVGAGCASAGLVAGAVVGVGVVGVGVVAGESAALAVLSRLGPKVPEAAATAADSKTPDRTFVNTFLDALDLMRSPLGSVKPGSIPGVKPLAKFRAKPVTRRPLLPYSSCRSSPAPTRLREDESPGPF